MKDTNLTSLPAFDSRLFQRLVAFRSDLHEHPELSWKENRTADQICKFLNDLAIDCPRDIAGTGIIAEIPGRVARPLMPSRAPM